MPYFHTTNVNILFLHVPKTGGTSITNYFLNKYNLQYGPHTLITYVKTYDGVHYHHVIYSKIRNHNECFNIDYDNLTIMTCVRNPYDRTISDLFHNSLITSSSTPEEVFSVLINDYLLDSNIIKYDNHPLPQYMFILDTDGTLLKNVKILYTEHLTHNMQLLGYDDFCVKDNVCLTSNVKKYSEYLNEDSIKLINTYYAKDFEYFNYEMK